MTLPLLVYPPNVWMDSPTKYRPGPAGTFQPTPVVVSTFTFFFQMNYVETLTPVSVVVPSPEELH